MMLLLVILLGIYLRELRTENIYGLLSSLYFVKRGFFMILLLVILLGIYLRELRTENVYEAIKLPLFTKEGLFMMLLLVVLLEIYLRELRTENVYGLLSSPSFAKRGLGGDSLFQSIQNQFPHHFNMRFFSIQCGDIVIRDTAMI